MLLVLWDALMLTMSEAWTRKGVANLACCEAPELARYFHAGLQVGSKPLFDSTCFNLYASLATEKPQAT